MPFHDASGVRLFYTADGPAGGLPLLLVHGWGADSHTWSWHVGALAERHRVIAVDLRGHGRSSVPDAGNDPRHMAADLAGLLEALATGPVVAIGHSMGGQVVTLLAGECPALVRGVVAIDPAYGATGDELAVIPVRDKAFRAGDISLALAMNAGAVTAGTPEFLKVWRGRRMLGTPAHVLAQAYAGMYTAPDAIGVRAHSERYLTKRRCPVLTLWTFAEAAAWERSLSCSTVVCWPGAGHYVHEERPSEFLVLLDDWLLELVRD